MNTSDTPTVCEAFLQTPILPTHFPNLICAWNFSQNGEKFPAVHGENYTLQSQSGALLVERDPLAWGGQALYLEEGQWLSLPADSCTGLNRCGPGGHLTLVAWVKRGKKSHDQCEFIAGRWNETQGGRQYGLFYNISVWQRPQTAFAHISAHGGPTPGYKFCMDGAQGISEIPVDEWHCVAMTYDGIQATLWLDGVCQHLPGLNPYTMPGGLFHPSGHGSDFTVGAVDRGGEIGNFFTGWIAGLAVYARALSPAEIVALTRSQPIS